MIPVKTPVWLQKVKPDFIWRVPANRKVLYLTFDDGPTPGVTDKALDLLKVYQAKATFFCVGNNIRLHNALFNRILQEGHAAGNHTFYHESGITTSGFRYRKSYLETAGLMQSALFRPPYGRIKRGQAKSIQKRSYVVMWDVLSKDYDNRISARQCAENVIRNAEKGSVVVFHDSKKAAKNMLYSLEQTLRYFSEKGFTFEQLTADVCKQTLMNKSDERA